MHDEDLAQIALQERELQFDSFDSETAFRLGAGLRGMAVQRKLGVAIDITLFSMPLFYTALDGSSPDNAGWVRRKRNCVFRFFRSSYAVGLSLAKAGSTIGAKFGLPDEDYAPHGGSFPVTVRGAGVIGAVTVSGLPQRDDHAMVVEALATILGKDAGLLRLTA